LSFYVSMTPGARPGPQRIPQPKVIRYHHDPETGETTPVTCRRSYTNEERREIVRYWKTPSIRDVATGKLRARTLEEVEEERGVPKSNVQRWASELDKIVNGRATHKKNRPRKGEVTRSKGLSTQRPQPKVVSTCGGVGMPMGVGPRLLCT
jgi:hypothetical protein